MLRSRIPLIITGLEPRVVGAIGRGAEAVAEEARLRVHVVTGDLRDSIEATQTDAGGWIVGTELAGVFEEFGTSRQPAHPFLVPALESQRSAIEDLVTDVLKDL